MSDLADLASEREQIDTARAISAARARVAAGPKPCGACYNCLDPVPADTLFCDADCRDDWQARQPRVTR